MTRVGASAAAFVAFAFMAAPFDIVRTTLTELPWCGDADGVTQCSYASLAECQKWRRPEGSLCVPNPRNDVID